MSRNAPRRRRSLNQSVSLTTLARAHSTLNDRVDYAFSLQTTLMELLNAKTSHRLEWIIIIVRSSSQPLFQRGELN